MSTTDLPEIGTQAFWNLYDDFCKPDHLENLISKGVATPLSSAMCELMESAHRSKAIHSLSRVGRGWVYHKAWITLRNTEIRDYSGNHVAFEMRVGDVVVVETGWDRDVIITHNPIPRNIVSGYLLSGKWEGMVGLFMPLFDKDTIMKCIEFRTAKNIEDAIVLAKEESQTWQWY